MTRQRRTTIARRADVRAMRTPTGSTDKRSRLIETAARLTHRRGFNQTSLADIARESGVPLGNVYYYFKTKAALGEALVERIGDIYDRASARWEADSDPRRRLEAFIQMTVDNRESLARSGCPVGTLCAELHKDGGPLADRAAKLFAVLLRWIEAQFRAMGKGSESPNLAIHLLSATQGASLLAHSFHDSKYVTREAARLVTWIRGL